MVRKSLGRVTIHLTYLIYVSPAENVNAIRTGVLVIRWIPLRVPVPGMKSARCAVWFAAWWCCSFTVNWLGTSIHFYYLLEKYFPRHLPREHSHASRLSRYSVSHSPFPTHVAYNHYPFTSSHPSTNDCQITHLPHNNPRYILLTLCS